MANKNNPIDKSTIRELAEILSETDLTEIEVEQYGIRIRVARATQTIVAQAPAPVAPQPAPMPVAQPLSKPASDQPVSAEGAVTSPMVGTAYRSPEPGAKAFVEVGGDVREGQTVLIVEAMKTFNPIASPRDGTVKAILVDDGQPVEYGEPLIVIE
ncbi:MAG: acetyl-CoA carboxylase biotin carboxyl carrier protein [Pseudomonadota bacterium]